MSTFTSQEQSVINRGTRQDGPFCPACEHPISDDNRLSSIPAYLDGIKESAVPPELRGIGWHDDGCQACVDEIVYDFAKYWLGGGVGSMEDVAGLIADHLELHLPHKVTA